MRYVGGVVLEGAEVRIAAALARIAVRHLERADGSAPGAARELLARLEGFAAETRDGALASGSTGQRFAPESEVPDTWLAVPEFLTAAQAAAVIGISEQAVTARCRSGSLAAVRSRGRWEVDPRAAAALAGQRKGA